jgi:hypothetical protein
MNSQFVMMQEAFDLNEDCDTDKWRHADTPEEAQAVLKEATTSLFRNQVTHTARAMASEGIC